MEKKYLTIDEAAEYLRMRKKTLYNLVWKKEIPYYKVGKKLLFRIDKLEAWIERYFIPEIEFGKINKRGLK